MKLKKELETEVLQVYDTWLHSYLNGDVEGYDSYLDEEYHFIGSTDNEEFLNRKDTTNFFEDTADQLAGKTEIRNDTKTVEQFGELIFITHLFDGWFLNGAEWAYYGRFRFTSAMRRKNEGWRFVYQHFSTTDSKAQEGETLGVEQITKENQELREAIKRRTIELEHKNRELEVEAALERVRARTMAMQYSDELAEVSSLLFEQMKALGIQTYSSGFTIWDEKQDELISWMCNADGSMNPPFRMPVEEEQWHKEQYESWKKDEEFIVKDLKGEEIQSYFRYLRSFPLLDEAFKKSEAAGHPMPERQVHHVANFSHGNLLFITLEPRPEAHDIFMRFAKVFEQTYTRFLDLQKAEAQAREAEIGLALERVRARTMAMQHSEELSEASFILDSEVRALGIQTRGCAFNIYGEDESTEWFSSEQGTLPTYKTPRENVFLPYFEAGQRGETMLIEEYADEACAAHYEYLCTLPIMGDALKEMIANGGAFPTRQVDHVTYFKYGYLLFITLEHVPEAHDIFKRFAKVFEQTYARFLDLQKAEAQAREAQIQLALERVRARTMAMHKSEELAETAAVLFQQMAKLSVTPERINICLINEESNALEVWSTDQEGTKINHHFNASLDEPTTGQKVYKAWKEKKKSLTIDLSGDELNNWIRYVREVMGMTIKEEFVKEHRIHFVAFFSHGMILTTTPEPLSEESMHLLERFADVFNLTYRRFLDLQKAEVQAREAQIEAALERVRSCSLAMHNADELKEVVLVIVEKLKELGVILDANGITLCTYFPNSRDVLHWIASPDGSRSHVGKYLLPYFDHVIFKEAWQSKEQGDTYFSKAYSVKEKNSFFEHAFKHSDYKHFPDEVKQWILDNDKHTLSFAWQKNSALLIPSNTGITPTEYEKDILIRFSKVFEQAYIRFMDLQKAEKQARKAQIEASLERVRAKAMSMQNSDELDEVLSVLCEQFDVLGIVPMSTHMTVFNFENNTFTFRETGKYGNRSFGEQTVALDAMDNWKETVDKWKADKATAINKLHFPKEQLPEVWKVFHESFASMPKDSRITPKDYPNGIYHTAGKHPFGYIGMNQIRPATEEEEQIVIKFANEFGMAYQRFLDLKKAEEQAREAQVEAALERVRSRSMGMQKGDELVEVVRLLDKEIFELGIEVNGTQIITDFAKPEDGLNDWFAIEGQEYLEKFHIPYIDHPCTERFMDALNGGVDFYTDNYSKAEKDNYFRLLFKVSDFRKIPKERQELVYDSPGWVRAIVVSKNSALVFQRYSLQEFTKDEEEIFKRIGTVFEQVYTRFLDLQKAEAQAREALKQSTLDRVRAQISSMRRASDLEQIIPLIWHELENLGVSFIRCGLFIMDDENTQIDTYLSTPDGQAITSFKLPYEGTSLAENALKFWRQGETYHEEWDKENFIEWTQNLIDNGFIESKEDYSAGKIPEHLSLHFIPFKQGSLYIGNAERLSEEDLDLAQTLANTFSTAYARYEDFQKIEAAKAKIEQAYGELEAAKDQLVQQEKLASLGQLTAGIAHEIKNPLNFVNNFSEVSVELIEEVREELSVINGQLSAASPPESPFASPSEAPRRSSSEASAASRLGREGGMGEGQKGQILMLLDDIEANLRKIHEHGSRADSIVKSMLQHSRGGSETMEPTYLNKLVKEFVNLAFHGMRAGKHPINVDVELDLDEGVGEVTLNAEDFSRVMINLCSNAFDAMWEKLSASGGQLSAYRPKLVVRTFRKSDQIIVEIEDNGPGIREEVKDKILQPFFTTKKGTSGTGLGLSITHDIVKAHGGILEIVNGSEGATCTVILPISR